MPQPWCVQIRLNASKDAGTFAAAVRTTTILPFTFALPTVPRSWLRSMVNGKVVDGDEEDLEHAFSNDAPHTNAAVFPMPERKSRLSIFDWLIDDMLRCWVTAIFLCKM